MVFNKRIFWDTDITEINPALHGVFLLERVMRYGTIEDWKVLRSMYSREDLVEFAKQAKDIDEVSASFLSAILQIDQKQMRCFTHNVSPKNFWNF